MNLTFALIGAAKSGTSSVYAYLSQHPDVFLSAPKEPKFFQWDGDHHRYSTPLDDSIFANSISNWSDYQALFAGAGCCSAVGEGSVSYLYNAEVPRRLHARFPNVKLMAILRRPDERAFSQYVQTKWIGHEPLDFASAIAQERQRIEQNWGPSWHYVRQGFYSEQIARYQQYFDQQQMKFWLYDDLKRDPALLVKEMYEFIGVDNAFQPDISKAHNVRTFPRLAHLDNLINGQFRFKKALTSLVPERIKHLVKRSNQERLTLPESIRGELIEKFTPEIDRLEKLLDRDLSAWREIPR